MQSQISCVRLCVRNARCDRRKTQNKNKTNINQKLFLYKMAVAVFETQTVLGHVVFTAKARGVHVPSISHSKHTPLGVCGMGNRRQCRRSPTYNHTLWVWL
jgi:hypothetical protein